MKFSIIFLAFVSLLAAKVCADPVTDALSTIAAQHQQDQATIQQQSAQITALKAAIPAPQPAPKGWLGTNIASNGYAGTDAKWADITHQATGWYNIPATPAAAILTDQYGGKTIAPAYFTADGYPLCPAQADIYPTGYPTGDYAVTWEGAGTISFGSAVKFAAGANGNSGTITISNLSQPVRIAVNPDPKNPIRNLHIWCPGYGPGTANAALVYRKEYSALLGRFSCVRTMDAQDTNTNDDVNWTDRVTPNQWCQTGTNIHGLHGMALEYLVTMANEAHVDLWVNIPINASADYVAHMAQICHGCNGKVHVEYGNEVWNSTMPLCQKAILKVSDDPITAFNYDGPIIGGKITPYLDAAGKPRLGTDSLTRAARRTVEGARANAIAFRAVFADRPGALKCVWAGQAAWNAWAQNGLDWEAAKFGATIFDELAIAPYTNSAPGSSLDQLFANLNAWLDASLPGQLDSHQSIAQKYGLKLVCYESGQSFWPQSDIAQQLNADPTGKNITDITYLAQLDPRMGAAYDKYFSILHAHGVTHCEHYSFIGSWNKFSYFNAWRSISDSNPRTQSLLAEAGKSK